MQNGPVNTSVYPSEEHEPCFTKVDFRDELAPQAAVRRRFHSVRTLSAGARAESSRSASSGDERLL